MKPTISFKDQLSEDLTIVHNFRGNLEKISTVQSINRIATLIDFNFPPSEPVPLEDFVLSIIKTAEGAKIYFEDKNKIAPTGSEQNQIVGLLSDFCREAKQINPLLELLKVSSGNQISKEANSIGQKLRINPDELPKHLSKLITSICSRVHEHTVGDTLYDSNLRIEKLPGSKQRWNTYIEKNATSLNCTVPPQEYYFIWVLGYARVHNIEKIMKRGELLDEQIIQKVPVRIHRILTEETTFAWNRRIGGTPTYLAAQQSKMKSVINGKLDPEFIVLEDGYYRVNFKIKPENIKIPHISRLP